MPTAQAPASLWMEDAMCGGALSIKQVSSLRRVVSGRDYAVDSLCGYLGISSYRTSMTSRLATGVSSRGSSPVLDADLRDRLIT